MNENFYNKNPTLGKAIGVSIGVLIGIVLTLAIEYYFINSWNGIFQNINITVSLNETRFVEEFNKTMISTMR